MALTNKTFGSLITYARTGTTTVVNSAGLVASVAADTPRFDHDPVTGAAKGLLIEAAATNLLTDSEDFTQSAWTKTRSSILPRQIVAPDGKVTADKLIADDTASDTHFLQQSVSWTNGTTYTCSVFAKKAEYPGIALQFSSSAFGTSKTAYFDLVNGEVESTGLTAANSGIDDYGNGWYRCWISDTATVTTSANLNGPFLVETLPTGATFTGDNTSGVYIFGAVLETGAVPTSYIPTPASFTSRASTATYFDSAGVLQTAAIDEARTTYKRINGVWTDAGPLHEAAATNLLLRSEEFNNASWPKTQASTSGDAIAAPDGTTTADKLIEDTATSEHYAQQTISSLTGTYTFSVFAKAAEKRYLGIREASVTADRALFDLENGVVTSTVGSPTATIEDVSGGWYRCTLTPDTAYSSQNFTPRLYLTDDSGGIDANSYTGDGTSGLYLWGAQLEANDYATSYIPTTTTSVTRSADVVSSSTATRNADDASITGTAFSDWFNASEGTVFVEFAASETAPSSNQSIVQFTDGTTNERLSLLIASGSGAISFTVLDGGATQANISGGAASSANKVAFAFAANDFAQCVDGGTVATDISGTLPTVDRLWIGSRNGSDQRFNGHIKNIKFYPSRLTDAELQALTT